jgi:hypothetical protein
MTLLITLASTSAIHQSSDYRLSYKGVPLETRNGVKQVHFSAVNWTGFVTFSGISSDDQGYNTISWLTELSSSLDPALSVEAFVSAVAARGTVRLNRATGDRRLTLLVAAVANSRCQLYELTNWERQDVRDRCGGLGALSHRQINISVPTVLVHGARRALPAGAREALLRQYRATADIGRVRAALEACNRLAHSRNRQEISPQCWVHSLFKDGGTAGFNSGRAPGSPTFLWLGTDASQIRLPSEIQQSARTLIQMVGVRGAGVPTPPPEGPERVAAIISPSAEWREPNSALPRITMLPSNTQLTLRKNQTVTFPLCTAELEIDPARKYSTPMDLPAYTRIACLPSVDGASPRDWQYICDFKIIDGSLEVTLRQLSVALRSKNLAARLPLLADDEELVLVAPTGSLVLVASRESPLIRADLLAQIQIRGFPELRTSAGGTTKVDAGVRD